MGIDNRKLYALALGIAMIFTAIAGVLFAIRTIFDPAAGPIRLILAFEAVIIGGLGNMWGTLIGGVVLGVAQAVGAALSPTWQILAGHIAFLVILIVRPSGLFPRTKDLGWKSASNGQRKPAAPSPWSRRLCSSRWWRYRGAAMPAGCGSLPRWPI